MRVGGVDLPSETCRAVGDVLERIGSKWSILIMVLLAERPRRFNEMRREIAVVTQKVLTSTLRGLERDGYVARMVLEGNVTRVEYALTPLGRDVLGPMDALARWALSRQDDVNEARRSYDERAA